MLLNLQLLGGELEAEHPAYLSKKLETQHFATNSSPFCIYTPTNRLWSIAGACTTYGSESAKEEKGLLMSAQLTHIFDVVVVNVTILVSVRRTVGGTLGNYRRGLRI